MAYKKFNNSPVDRYPTFSVCFSFGFQKLSLRTGEYVTLQEQFRNELKSKFGINGEEYNQILKGKAISRSFWGTTISFSNISRFDHKQYTFKLASFIERFRFRTRERHQDKYHTEMKRDNESMPFYFSYADPDRICFTRKSEIEYGFVRITDDISINFDYLLESAADLEVYIHHPGQLTRSFGKPDFFGNLYHQTGGLDGEKNSLTFTLDQVTTLRKRPTARVPCDPYLQDDDFRFKKEVIWKVGCVPVYWKFIMPNDDSIKSCITSKEMADILHEIKSKNSMMESYGQPCTLMTTSVTTTSENVNIPIFTMQVHYMIESYQEFVNNRDFGFESFWSGVGGFVGIFLGYSLMQVPGLVDKLWYRYTTRKMTKQGSFNFKICN